MRVSFAVWGNEVRGRAGLAQPYGLVFDSLPLQRGREVKIVWRMTGTGDLSVTASGPGTDYTAALAI